MVRHGRNFLSHEASHMHHRGRSSFFCRLIKGIIAISVHLNLEPNSRASIVIISVEAGHLVAVYIKLPCSDAKQENNMYHFFICFIWPNGVIEPLHIAYQGSMLRLGHKFGII